MFLSCVYVYVHVHVHVHVHVYIYVHVVSVYAHVYIHIYSSIRSHDKSFLYLYLQAGLLEDLRGHMGSSMQLLQQLQSQATKLEGAQTAIARELRAQRRERGETLRRATLELALAELTHGRVDHVGQSPARGLTRTLVQTCYN